MRASALEFRLRMLIIVAIVSLGFTAPWIGAANFSATFAQRISLLEWLALQISRLDLVRFTLATPLVIVAGMLIAALAVVLRVSGTAYLGAGTVHNAQMQAGALTVDGPYRYVRNPLYLGLWCMIAAMTLMMPPSGALFVMALVTLFLLRLILGEEAFLTTRLGNPYREYLRSVPRLIPRLRTSFPSNGTKPNWPRALLAELNPIGVFLTLAVFSWSYDNRLMIRAILISLGVSLIVRALMPATVVSPDHEE